MQICSTPNSWSLSSLDKLSHSIMCFAPGGRGHQLLWHPAEKLFLFFLGGILSPSELAQSHYWIIAFSSCLISSLICRRSLTRVVFPPLLLSTPLQLFWCYLYWTGVGVDRPSTPSLPLLLLPSRASYGGYWLIGRQPYRSLRSGFCLLMNGPAIPSLLPSIMPLCS